MDQNDQNITPETKKHLERIANTASRSDKVSWNRKMDNMIRLLAKIKPIEDEILDLHAKKTEVVDEIAELRRVMVAECIHPFNYLVEHEDYVLCKFCDKKIVNLKNKNG